MPKFKKQVVTSGFYVVNNGKGGRRVEVVTPNRLKHWADQFQEMKRAGLNIPAPAYHTPKAVPESKDDEGWTKTEEGSKANYGFWEDLGLEKTVNEEGQETLALSGVLDAPLEQDAEKVGKTVKATSVCVQPEFIDGKGRIWKDVITHIYVGNDAIEPNQKNFESVGDGQMIAMSNQLPINMAADDLTSIMNDAPLNSTDDLIELLEKVAGVCIPKGTPTDELPRALTLALKQKELSEKKSTYGSVSKPPTESQINEVPVVMSNQQQQTTQPNEPTMIDPNLIMSHPTFQKEQEKANTLLMSLTTNKKEELKQRLKALQERGIVSSKEDVETYMSQIEGLEVSLNEKNEIQMSHVEAQLAALEKVKIPMPPNRPVTMMSQQTEDGNFIIQDNPLEQGSGAFKSEEDIDKFVDQLFSRTSV